ncbi:MAG: serine/threonine-protein kinase, partial [Arenimonas sp.]
MRSEPTVLHATGQSVDPEHKLRQQAGLAALAFGSAEYSGSSFTATQHLAFLPPEELTLDLDDPAQCELGDYTLLEKIGQGGMGVVYRARQASLDREVALKLLAAGPWASRDFIERFRREAQSAARMQHPNIVAIFEIGRHEELNFFSMRLVDGPSLAQRLADGGPMAPRAAAQMLRTVAEAVDYAHRLGVLHLDLKPGNVLIDETGQAMVADFGLARRMDESLGHDSDEVSGTPSYMAPEQAQLKSHRLSPATDIYGLGAIGFEMLTGKPPFRGDSPHETLLRVVMIDAPRLRELRADLPADLEAIIGRCLAQDPDQRYPSARALADDLGRFLDYRSVQARPLNRLQRIARWAQREPKLAMASAFAAAALVTGLVATTHQWSRAESNAKVASQRLWEGRRESALQLEANGHGWDAVDRLLRNITEQQVDGHDAGADADRLRLGMLLGQGAVLIDSTLVADATPLAVAVSDDGARVALALGDRSVRWYDSTSLAEQGRIDL